MAAGKWGLPLGDMSGGDSGTPEHVYTLPGVCTLVGGQSETSAWLPLIGQTCKTEAGDGE